MIHIEWHPHPLSAPSHPCDKARAAVAHVALKVAVAEAEAQASKRAMKAVTTVEHAMSRRLSVVDCPACLAWLDIHPQAWNAAYNADVESGDPSRPTYEALMVQALERRDEAARQKAVRRAKLSESRERKKAVTTKRSA